MADYSQIDNSPLLGFLFYPRRHVTPPSPGAFDLPVPVGKEVSIFCRFFEREKTWPWILYFKGFRQDPWVMGRSMGSRAAVELAYHDGDRIKGMVIESGFANVPRLIKHFHLPCG